MARHGSPAHSGALNSGSPAPSSGAVRQRRTPGRASSPSSGPSTSAASKMSSGAGILKFYTEEGEGLKLGPTTVLVTSLVFILSVIVLHIAGKYLA